LLAAGFLIVLVGAFGWVLEPPAEPARRDRRTGAEPA